MQIETEFTKASNTKFPEQVAIAIAQDKNGIYNPITLGWVMQTSFSPPMMAISVGKTRYSCSVIRQKGEFVIAFPSANQEKETMLFGTKSGRDTEKLTEAKTKNQPAHKIDSLLLTDAVANFECKLVSELETGDHCIFVGEVLCSHINQTPLNRLYTLNEKIKMGALPRQ